MDLSPLNLLYGGSSMLGSLFDFLQNMEDRNYWKAETKEAKERIQGNETDPGLRNRLFYGTDEYDGIMGIMNKMLPSYEGLANTTKQGAANLQRDVANGYTNFYNNLTGFIDEKTKDQVNAYNSRESKAMGMLEGMGTQAKKDINQSYDNLRGKTTSNLASRGLGGTGVAASMERGNERERQNSLGRLDESLRQQKLDTYTGLSKDTLMAKERGDMAQAEAGSRIGLSGLQSASDLGQWGVGVSTAADEYALGQRMNTMMLPHELDKYTTELTNSTVLGYGLPPEVPSVFTRWATNLSPWMAQGAGGGGGGKQKAGGGASFLGIGANFSCIAATSMVETEDGPMPIEFVQPGDRVLGSDGEYHRVVAKDCGSAEPDYRFDLYELRDGDHTIRATGDHTINGVLARDWEEYTRVPYEATADIMLEGNVDYMANGFVCASNIGALGHGRWAEFIAPQCVEDEGVLVCAHNSGVWAVLA